MDPAPPPPARGPRPGDGERRRLSTSTLVAVLVAATAAVITVLLTPTLRGNGFQAPAPAARQGPDGPNFTRIDYDELLRLAGPYVPLYKAGLPPFHNLRPLSGRPNQTDHAPELQMETKMAAGAAAIIGVPPADRFVGVYPATGKIVPSPGGVQCSGVMVSENIMLTADHCLPWDSDDKKVWQAIKFIPAFDGSVKPPDKTEPFLTATIDRCVGISPSTKDGLDTAACKLSWDIGTLSGYVKTSYPDPNWSMVDQAAWYTSQSWYSIGYPKTFKGGNSPAVDPDVSINDVSIDPFNGCSLLKTGFFADHGWSGGPVFSQTPDATGHTILSALVDDCVTPIPDCVNAGSTLMAGGYRLVSLVTWGILKWNLEIFDESPV